MKQAWFTLICHTNGKHEIVPTRRDKLLQWLKRVGIILAVLLMAILFCGAALTSEHSAKWLQVVLVFGLSAFVIISAVVWSVMGGK